MQLCPDLQITNNAGVLTVKNCCAASKCALEHFKLRRNHSKRACNNIMCTENCIHDDRIVKMVYAVSYADSPYNAQARGIERTIGKNKKKWLHSTNISQPMPAFYKFLPITPRGRDTPALIDMPTDILVSIFIALLGGDTTRGCIADRVANIAETYRCRAMYIQGSLLRISLVCKKFYVCARPIFLALLCARFDVCVDDIESAITARMLYRNSLGCRFNETLALSTLCLHKMNRGQAKKLYNLVIARRMYEWPRLYGDSDTDSD